MRWDIAPECVSAVILLIIWGYSRRGSPLPSLKNRVFQGCLIITFLAVSTNILSTLLLMRPGLAPQWLVWGVTTLYFICTPLMGLAYFLYSAAILCKGQPMLRWVFAGGITLGALYALLALADPLTGKLFSITPEGGYRQGEWIALTYLLFYAYCAASILLVLRFRHSVERSTRTILLSFPAVAFVVILVQQFFPTVILSGSAATCALLIIYLHLQNKQMSLDSLTGAPNRQELVNLIDLLLFEKRLPTFTVAVLSLRDFKQINSRFGQSVGDLFLKRSAAGCGSWRGRKTSFASAGTSSPSSSATAGGRRWAGCWGPSGSGWPCPGGRATTCAPCPGPWGWCSTPAAPTPARGWPVGSPTPSPRPSAGPAATSATAGPPCWGRSAAGSRCCRR